MNRRFTMLQTQQKSTRTECSAKEHDDRGEVDHEECLKHTQIATHAERETKADDMMSTTSTRNAWTGVRGERRSTARTARTASLDAACEGPCKQREVNRSSAE